MNVYNKEKYYQLESEQYGDETAWIIVDKNFHIVKDIFGYNIDDCYDDLLTTLKGSLD